MSGEGDQHVHRGYFWWSEEKIPRNCFAPANCVTGQVVIKSDGLAILELDGIMAGEETGFAALSNLPGRPRKAIQGKLKDGSSILLFSVIGDGGNLSSHGISFQRFRAAGSLISRRPFKHNAETLLVTKLVFSLEPLAEWTRRGGIDLKRSLKERNNSQIVAKYKPFLSYKYRSDNKSIRIFNFVDSPFPTVNLNTVELKSIAYFEYECGPIVLTEVENIRRQVNDFFCLLIGRAIHLDSLRVVIRGREVEFNHWHSAAEPAAVKTEDCWIPYEMISSEMGRLFFAWLEKRNKFGPAFYVLLGHKRLAINYFENQFSALASGAEAFSRILDNPPLSKTTATKVDEIVDSIADTTKRKWLRKRLRNAAEPNLQQRFFAIFSRVDLCFSAREMQRFCQNCMSLRHDISHFGGPRKHPDYEQFIKDVGSHMRAFELFYHVSILNEIGVERCVILHMLFEGYQSIRFAGYLTAVGFTLPPEFASRLQFLSKTE